MKDVTRHRWHWVTARPERGAWAGGEGPDVDLELRCRMCLKFADDLVDAGAELRVCLGRPVELKKGPPASLEWGRRDGL